MLDILELILQASLKERKLVYRIGLRKLLIHSSPDGCRQI